MPNIRHEVVVGASAQTVYDAITTQQGLAGWWTPDAVAQAQVDAVLRFPFGPHYFKAMQVTALEPAKRVAWRCTHGAAEWIDTILMFELHSGGRQTLLAGHPEATGQLEQQDKDNAVLLVFRHDNWRDYTPMFAECSYTWALFLRSLKLYCETGKGRPWPLQHGV